MLYYNIKHIFVIHCVLIPLRPKLKEIYWTRLLMSCFICRLVLQFNRRMLRKYLYCRVIWMETLAEE